MGRIGVRRTAYVFPLASFAVAVACAPPASAQASVRQVPFADPCILAAEGRYYAFGTHSPQGICCAVSDDLKVFRYSGAEPGHLALKAVDSWGSSRFWAPEVYRVKGRYLMYYSAEEHICAAWADRPEGPYRQTVKKPMLEERGIDSHLFIDDNGKPYLFWVRFNRGNHIWVAELEDDLETVRTNTMTFVMKPDQEWETSGTQHRVTEGPFVVKHDGVYYLTYSGNSYKSPLYGIGYATAKSPMGPWTKCADNPLFQKPEGLDGVGHHAFFRDFDGKDRIVFHAHCSKGVVHPRGMHLSSYGFDAVGNIRIDGNWTTPSLASPGIGVKWAEPKQVARGGYARVHRLNDGRLMLSYSRGGDGWVRFSADGGESWSDEQIAFRRPVETSLTGGPDPVTVHNCEFAQLAPSNPHRPGRIVLAANLRTEELRTDSTPLSIAIVVSDDGGASWSGPKILYRGEVTRKDERSRGCYEPFVLELPDGTVQVYFADESPYAGKSKFQNISLVESKDGGENWGSARIVSCAAHCRDGMPAAMSLDGRIYVALETNTGHARLHPEIVTSGVTDCWKDVVTENSPTRFNPLDRPLPKDVYAGAPYLAKTDNFVLLSYQQADPEPGVPPKEWRRRMIVRACLISDVKDGRFPPMSEICEPLASVARRKSAMWNSLCALEGDDFLYIGGVKDGIWIGKAALMQ